MSERMRAILESKRAMRRKLSALPFSEKVKLLEKLRKRSLLLASSRVNRRENAVGKERFALWVLPLSSALRFAPDPTLGRSPDCPWVMRVYGAL
jgi:hypothetical protein